MSGGWQKEPFLFNIAVNMTELAECYVLSRICVTGIRIQFEIILAVSHKYKGAVYIVNEEAEVNKSLYNSLIMLPVRILNIFFCTLKIFSLREVFYKYINPQFITEWTKVLHTIFSVSCDLKGLSVLFTYQAALHLCSICSKLILPDSVLCKYVSRNSVPWNVETSL